MYCQTLLTVYDGEQHTSFVVMYLSISLLLFLSFSFNDALYPSRGFPVFDILLYTFHTAGGRGWIQSYMMSRFCLKHRASD